MLELMIYIMLACLIFGLVEYWKFSVKTGVEYWKFFIPFYSEYLLLKIAGMDIYWFLLLVLQCIFIFCFGEYLFIVIIAYVITIFISLYYCFSLAVKFNKGIGFGLGLFFLNPIFMAILAFDKKCIYNK